MAVVVAVVVMMIVMIMVIIVLPFVIVVDVDGAPMIVPGPWSEAADSRHGRGCYQEEGAEHSMSSRSDAAAKPSFHRFRS